MTAINQHGNARRRNTPDKSGMSPRLRLVLVNLGAMVAVGLILVWIALLFLDNWTNHGQETEVPSVRGISYDMACQQLAAGGFECEVTDSVYDTTSRPGTVMDQSPKPGSKVKEGRLVYVTINAFSPKTVAVPNLADMSVRQAQSTLNALGITKIDIHHVPSDFKDLVIGVNCNGRPLTPGTRLPVSSRVTILVGSGYQEDTDSVSVAEESLFD